MSSGTTTACPPAAADIEEDEGDNTELCRHAELLSGKDDIVKGSVSNEKDNCLFLLAPCVGSGCCNCCGGLLLTPPIALALGAVGVCDGQAVVGSMGPFGWIRWSCGAESGRAKGKTLSSSSASSSSS